MIPLSSRVQQRWVFAVMGSLAIMNVFTMRMCLSIAITDMVKPVQNRNNETWSGACPAAPASSTESNSRRGGVYEWDEYTQGLILSSFFWGYILLQIPGGLLSEKFGGKYILGLPVLSTGMMTFLIPPVVEGYGSTGLILLRFLTGLCEGIMPPAITVLIAQWAPPNSRARISTMVFSGMPIGTVMGTALSGILIQQSSIGWPLVFYFFGTCAIVWFFAWVVLCHSYPEEHPFITEKEKKYLKEAMSQHTQRKKKPLPWGQAMTSGPLFAMLIGNLGFAWGFTTLTSDLPKYMSDVLKFSIEANGFLSALPHVLTLLVGNTASWLTDRLIKKEKISRTTARKVLFTMASVLSGVFLIAASYAGCDRTLVVTFFTLSIGAMGFNYPSIMVNINDLSPNYSGVLSSLNGILISLSGILAPYVVGILTVNRELMEWRIVFWIAFGFSVGALLIFIIFGDGEVQHWNDPESQGQKQTEVTVPSAGDV